MPRSKQTSDCRGMNAARLLLVAGLLALGTSATNAMADEDVKTREWKADLPFSESELIERVFTMTREYLTAFQHPKTHVLYGAKLATRRSWTSPADVKAGKPAPWGYGSRIADTALHTGHMLVAMLDAQRARPDPMLEASCRNLFDALKFIGALPETYPKANMPALSGLVPRGPHPDDPSAYYDDSSMDQHTTYILAMARYANSPLATESDKRWIRQSLDKVGRRLEKNGWSIKRADGVTQAHVGFSWKGFNSHHAAILLPAACGLAEGTGSEHWARTYEKFLTERDGMRWKLMHPGPHVQINAHPIYANQTGFRLNAYYRLEHDPERKAVIRSLLRQCVELQLKRGFPGPFYRKFHTAAAWERLRRDLGWKDTELHGCDEAWNMFRPAVLDKGSLAVLAHVRFPLGGLHMVILSEDPARIQRRLPTIWKMLTTVDLDKIRAGETHYLMTAVALHTYAFYFGQD